ncbi:MAG: hypothetical protein ACE5NN_04155, partial [Candidatus Bathyarchaeia archaeon]
MAFGRQFVKGAKAHLSPDRYTSVLGVKLVHGHHSSLKGFSSHEFQIKSKTLCAGCFGLLIGSLASLGGVIAYSVTEAKLSGVAHSIVGLGIMAVGTALVVPLFYSGRAVLRVLLNVALVLGMLSILIGIDTLTANLEIDLYLIGLSLFWMMNRILISRFNHEKIYATKRHAYTCWNSRQPSRGK